MALTILETIPLAGAQFSFETLHTLIRSPKNRFYLSDELNHRIIILGSDGSYHGSIGGPGTGPGEFRYPRGIAWVGDELLAVCDAWNNRIQLFDSDGRFAGSFGSIGSGQDQFSEPSVVLPYGEHSLAVLDRGNHRIKICSLSGETLSLHGTYIPSSFKRLRDKHRQFYECGYNYPEGMTITGDGAFVVADTGNRRISIFDPAGKIWKIIELDANDFPYSYPKSVAVLPDQNIAAWVHADAALWLIEGSAPHRIERLLCPDLTSSKFRPAVLPESLDTFLIFDSEQQVLMRCKISYSLSAEAVVPYSDMTTNQVKLWIEYFQKAEKTDAVVSSLTGFTTILKGSYQDHAKSLALKESAVEELVSKRNAFLSRAWVENSKSGASNEEINSISALQQAKEDLQNEEKAHAQSLDSLVLLFRSLSEQFANPSLRVEQESFHLMMEARLKRATEEYQTRLHRLKNHLMSGSSAFAQSAKDCIWLVNLYRNARNFRSVLNALPSKTTGATKIYEIPKLPISLNRFKDSDTGLVEGIRLILALLCIEWEFDGSARELIDQQSSVPDSRDSILFLLKEANARRKAGAHDQALKILDTLDALSLARLNEEERCFYFMEKGHALLFSGRAGEAIPCFHEAHPERADAPFHLCMNLAIAYEYRGRLDEAAKLYPLATQKAKASGVMDEYETAATGLIRIHFRSGAFEKAAELIRKLPPELSGKACFATFSASILHYRPEDDMDAVPELMALLTHHPNCAGLRLNLAVRYALNSNMPAAFEMIEKEETLSSGTAPLHFVKAVCLRIDGKFAEAVREYANDDGTVDLSGASAEIFLAAYAAHDENAMKQAVDLLKYNMQTDCCFSGFFNVPRRQHTLVEEAMAYFSKTIENPGQRLSLVWVNCSTLRYARKDWTPSCLKDQGLVT
jgi:tetratricopeptide (TPR) repeat protein